MPQDLTGLRIDWQILENLAPIVEMTEPEVTANNIFMYCSYYGRDEWFKTFKKAGYKRVDFISSSRTNMFWVVGYKD